MTEEKRGFIESNSDFICGVYPTYRAWAEALAMYQVAVANPFARIVSRGPGLPLTFNPWCIGPSRFGYKSTPLKDIVEPTIRKAELYILPPRFTVEGYYSLIWKKKITHAALIRDETSGMIVETHKQYLADELPFLAELLDERLTGRVTVTHGEVPQRKIRVNFATATTPHILSVLDANFWVQGLGNRLTPIYYIKPVVNGVPAEQSYLTFHGFISQYADVLKKMYKTKVEWVTPDSDVKTKIQLEEYSRREKAYGEYYEDKLDILPGMYFECQVHAQKIAALKAIDRQPGIKDPIIEMEDYDWGMKWITERFVEFEQLVKDWISVQLRKKTATIFTTPEKRIYRILMKTKYKDGLTKTRLNNLTHLTKDQREKALEKLIAEGTVEEITTFVEGKPKKAFRIKTN